MKEASDHPLQPDEFEAKLRAFGASHYHHLHPFHMLLHAGELNKVQLQAWALNRFQYQRSIPIKDATILSRISDPALRRVWRQRIIDHDGSDEQQGGIERWLRLTQAVGLQRDYVLSGEGVLPATRFAVQAYVQFVKERSLLEAIASSLTELFATSIIEQRIAGMLEHYSFIQPVDLAYFNERLDQAPKDANFALGYVLRHATNAAQQLLVLSALRFKCDVLWAQLDGLHHAYVMPGNLPADAFRPLNALGDSDHG